jgi:hypothetical protein
MKKLLFLAIFVCGSMFSSVSIGMDNKEPFTKDIAKLTSENYSQNTNAVSTTKDCTVRLDIELADGTTIQGEITFVDVSWWDCTKMQLAAWWERTF